MNDKTIIIYLLLLIAIVCFIYAAINKIKHIFLQYKIDKQQKQNKDRANRRKISAKMKAYILERDDYTCQICGISKQFFEDLCEGSGDYLLLEIDHITSVANGGCGDDEDNLQVLCWKCNRKKGGSKTNNDVYRSIDYGIEYLQPTRRKKWF